METQLASKHQMGHVMERGGTFVAAEDTGAIAAGGVSVYGDGSAANLHRNFINRQEMNKVGFPWTYSASTTTTTIKENLGFFCCVMKFGGWKLVLVCFQGGMFL
jgi:hypothetical protein